MFKTTFTLLLLLEFQWMFFLNLECYSKIEKKNLEVFFIVN